MSAVSDRRLQPLVGANPESHAPDDGQVRVVDVLRHLASIPAERRAPLDRARLTQLCHQIAVCKGVYATYDAHWRRTGDAKPLSPAGWALAAGVLLAHAEAGNPEFDEDPGLAFVCLNAALLALDRVGDAQGTAVRDTLHDWAEQRLRRVLMEETDDDA